MGENRQRLKQKDLVAALFVLFSEEYDRRGVDSILDIELPFIHVREYLRGRFGIDYTSEAWIATQLRKYEEEVRATLFRRRESADGSSLLGIAQDMRAYYQKRHLYVTQKIKVANGVLDLIMNEGPLASGNSAGNAAGRTVHVLLGAGSTVTRIAEALAERLRADRRNGDARRGAHEERSAGRDTWSVATHNLGAIQALGATGPVSSGVELLVPEGRIDQATYCILGKNEDLYRRLSLDWTIEGSSFLFGGELFVESAEESSVKSAILRRCSGKKILVLTGHEAVAERPSGLEPFGRVIEHDFVVLPRVAREGSAESRFDLAIRELKNSLDPWVLNWNYEVFRVRHTPVGEGAS